MRVCVDVSACRAPCAPHHSSPRVWVLSTEGSSSGQVGECRVIGFKKAYDPHSAALCALRCQYPCSRGRLTARCASVLPCSLLCCMSLYMYEYSLNRMRSRCTRAHTCGQQCTRRRHAHGRSRSVTQYSVLAISAPPSTDTSVDYTASPPVGGCSAPRAVADATARGEGSHAMRGHR